MKNNLLVNRYTRAFLDLAIENDIVDQALDDLLLVKKTIEENKELSLLINRPFVSITQKINIINRLFKERINELSLRFINLLIEKNREEIITNVYDEYYALYLEHKKIAVVTVTSAVSLDEKTTERIVNILKHKIVKKDTIEIKNVIDRNIIGGFIVKYMDYEYDASVRNTLKRLHSVFENNLFVKGFKEKNIKTIYNGKYQTC